jgi:glycosyltransferase involved in cell wall biosynthesis
MDYYYLARNLNISGGVKTLATHVWLLRKHGESAWLVNCGQPRDPWCLVLQEVTPYIIPASRFLTKNRSENAIIVVPEVYPPFIHKERREWRRSILVLLVLNWHYSDIFWGMRKVSSRSRSDRPKAFSLLEVLRRGVRFRRSVKRFGFHAILTNSEFSRRWVRRRLSYDPVVIPTGIDREIFFEKEDERETGRILLIGNKNETEIDEIKPELLRIPSVQLTHAKDFNESEMACEYRKSDIYLAFGKYEGLPRTVLEAMASGCAVVGYDGGGGKDFMKHRKTAMVARKKGDILKYTMELISNDALKERIRRGGKQESNRYTLEAQSRSLLATFQTMQRAMSSGTLSMKKDLHTFYRATPLLEPAPTGMNGPTCGHSG